jgi:hypothetical protein
VTFNEATPLVGLLVGALVVVVPVADVLCAAPSELDRFAMRVAAEPEKGVAVTPVLFVHWLGLLAMMLEEKIISAHYNDQSGKRTPRFSEGKTYSK